MWERPKLFELAGMLRRGADVTVSGDLKIREFAQTDGSKGLSLSVYVHRVEVHSRPQQQQPTPAPAVTP